MADWSAADVRTAICDKHWRSTTHDLACGFDAVSEAEGISARSFRRGARIDVFNSGIQFVPAAPFRGWLVVSLKLIPRSVGWMR